MFLVAGILSPLFAVAGESSAKDIYSAVQSSSSSIRKRPIQIGTASWYGPGFYGRPMANGKPYNAEALTIAHRTLPLGKIVHLRNLENGKTVIAKVTDRGPYIPGRIVDLSEATARKLGVTGLAQVALEINFLALKREPRRNLLDRNRPYPL